MAATLNRPASPPDFIRPSDIRRAVMEDDSPFGVQGLARDTLHILRPECIGPFAATLAICGTPQQIRDDAFVAQVLAERRDWQEEYRVVHLIEKSLWIDGHSDLVMTLTRDPSQIPDNPPPEILDVLSQAIEVHPESTVWYAVPLFSDENNADGLPLPMTAAQVREEAQRRVAAAQKSALRWRQLYRAANEVRKLPYAAWRFARACRKSAVESVQGCREYFRRAKRDVRNRNRAQIRASSEFCRHGRSFTKIPEHTTMLGFATEQTSASINATQDFLSDQIYKLEGMAPIMAGTAPVLLDGIKIISIAPLLIAPLTIIPCDPFLFIELPGETGKLRFLGHWYWQEQRRGKQKLHLHV